MAASNTATVNLERFNQNAETWDTVEVIEDATLDQMRAAWKMAGSRDLDGYYRVANAAGEVYLGCVGNPIQAALEAAEYPWH
jgi:hypothetical protein